MQPEMRPDRWKLVERLFLSAADLPSDEQARLLDQACGGDAELRAEIESLLASDHKDGKRISAAVETEAALLFDPPTDERIGPYRIIREIGRGGMGAVYLAVRDDDEYHKQVAIKVVKPGMDTAEVLGRFRHERQILANLDHPFIARLLDGGTTAEGRPFFVMDYVEGVPLDVFCRQPSVSVRARCDLFLRICEAVSYAHRNLVVHRDLKPGNIFVTPDSTPKLLDFGVAKLLDPESDKGLTVTHFVLPLTPEYASPEQVRGLGITTATDVYALGAIFYEMLTGERAQSIETRTPAGIDHAICETEVPRPSLSFRGLDDDLDNIVLMAMRKEPARRYQSVDQLSEDLRRHLDGRPVLARRDSFGYRARKFVRRNRVAIAAAALFVFVLVGGAATATLQARRATREQAHAEASRMAAEQAAQEAGRQRAEAVWQRAEAESLRRQADLQRTRAETERQLADHRFEQVRQLAGKFLIQFHDAIARLPGSTAAQKMVVETGLQYYDTLVSEANGNRDLLEEIARGYDRLGDVQGNTSFDNVGNPAAALASYRKARAIRESLSDPSPAFLAERIRGNIRIAQIVGTEGDLNQAREILEQTLPLGANATDFGVRDASAGVYHTYAKTRCLQDYHECIPGYLKFLEIAEALARDHGNTPADQTLVRLGHYSAGTTYSIQHEVDPALLHLRAAVEIDHRLVALDARDNIYLHHLYEDYLGLAIMFRNFPNLSTPDEMPIRTGEAAAELADGMLTADSVNVNAMRDVVSAQTSMGDWLRDHDDPAGSVVHYRKAMEAANRMAAAGSPSNLTENILRQTHMRLGTGLGLTGQLDEALVHFRQAEESLAREEKLRPGLPNTAIGRANLAAEKGEAYAKAQSWPEAIASFNAAVATFAELRKQHPENQAYLDAQTAIRFELSDCYAGNKQWPDAIATMQNVLDSVREIAARRPLTLEEEQARKEGPGKIEAWKQKL